MYHLKNYESVNDFPWSIPLSERIRRIYDAKKMGFRVVAYLYEEADSSTFRYRVYNMCQILELSLSWRGTWFFADEAEAVYRHIQNIDFAVAVRLRWDSSVDGLIDFLHANGRKAAFDIDDLVYDVKYIPCIMNALAVTEDRIKLDHWFAYAGRIAHTARKCDYIITTNAYLAGSMEADLQKEAYVVKNCLNRMQLEVSQEYYMQKIRQKSTGQFVVGYFSGSPTHINDLLVVMPDVLQALEECPEMVLRIVGFMKLPDAMREMEKLGRIECEPFVSFVKLQKKIAEVDVNIAPLLESRFTNCKSELKYFEAAAVGTVTCASPAYVFRELIEHGADGYLCGPGQWFDILKKLYDARRYGDHELCEKAYQKCIRRYAYYNLTDDLEKALDRMAGIEG